MFDATPTPGNVHPIGDVLKKAFPMNGTNPTGADLPELPFETNYDNINMDDYDDTPFGNYPVVDSVDFPSWTSGTPPIAHCPLYATQAVFRVLSVVRDTPDRGRVPNRADLFLDEQRYTVEWFSQKVDARIRPGALVEVVPTATLRETEGLIRIQRLRLVDRPRAAVNPFATIPPSWVKDRSLVERATALWKCLPRDLALLLNAVLWTGNRLHCYAMCPSSLNDHHKELGGNFIHSIEVAEAALGMANASRLANAPLLVLGGLLHDAGKAVEYRSIKGSTRHLLSERGELVGHRDTLVGWLAEARMTHGLNMGEGLFLGLMHMLCAARGAPDWLGLRSPRTREADILSQADSFSRMEYLRNSCAPPFNQPGFGGSHRNLGYRTYVTPTTQA
jgi:3'-5' exoribonuclease